MVRNFLFRSRRFQSYSFLSLSVFRSVIHTGHVVSPTNTKLRNTGKHVGLFQILCLAANSSFSLFVISFHDCLLCFHDFFSLSFSRRSVCILSSHVFSFFSFFQSSLVSVTRFSTKQHAYDFCPVFSYSFSSFFVSFFFLSLLRKYLVEGNFHQESRDSKTLAGFFIFCTLSSVLVIVPNLNLDSIELRRPITQDATKKKGSKICIHN